MLKISKTIEISTVECGQNSAWTVLRFRVLLSFKKTLSGMLRAKQIRAETPLGVRIAIAGRLLHASKDGRIPRGTVPAIVRDFGVSKATVYRINKKAVTSLANGSFDVSSKRKNRCGRKAKHDTMALQEALEGIPFSGRTTAALGKPFPTRVFTTTKKICDQH